MNHTGPQTFAKRIQFCRQPFGKGPGILSKQRQVAYVFFRRKTGAETERIRSGANNHHVTWFILALDFKISWIPISGTTRIPLTNKVWRTHSTEQLSSTGVFESTHIRISYVYFCGSKKKQLVEISWNTAPLEQSKTSTLLMDQILHHFICTNWLTSAFSNHLRRFFQICVSKSKVQRIEEMMS